MALRDEIDKGPEIQGESRKAAANFLWVELETSITFAETALSAGANIAKRERDRASARKGYDTILRFNQKYAVLPSASQEFVEKLRHLKGALEVLGDSDL